MFGCRVAARFFGLFTMTNEMLKPFFTLSDGIIKQHKPLILRISDDVMEIEEFISTIN